jgi:hypothetical protein
MSSTAIMRTFKGFPHNKPGTTPIAITRLSNIVSSFRNLIPLTMPPRWSIRLSNSTPMIKALPGLQRPFLRPKGILHSNCLIRPTPAPRLPCFGLSRFCRRASGGCDWKEYSAVWPHFPDHLVTDQACCDPPIREEIHTGRADPAAGPGDIGQGDRHGSEHVHSDPGVVIATG